MGFMLILQGIGLVLNIAILVYQLRTLKLVRPPTLNFQGRQNSNPNTPAFDARRRPPM